MNEFQLPEDLKTMLSEAQFKLDHEIFKLTRQFDGKDDEWHNTDDATQVGRWLDNLAALANHLSDINDKL